MTTIETGAVVWQCKHFDDLGVRELHDVLELRSLVFSVEQQCCYQDVDGKDPHCLHVMGKQGGRVVAAARIVPPGISYAEASIGRVVNAPGTRGTGIGVTLMRECMSALETRYGRVPVRIGAQHYLERFYNKFGFQTVSDVYDEDGIDHVEMLYTPA